MRKSLRLIAVAAALLSLGLWLARGAHRGWTQTTQPVKTVDEVTGIEGIQYQPRFVPGLDFLAGGLLGAAVLGGASFLFRSQSKT